VLLREDQDVTDARLRGEELGSKEDGPGEPEHDAETADKFGDHRRGDHGPIDVEARGAERSRIDLDEGRDVADRLERVDEQHREHRERHERDGAGLGAAEPGEKEREEREQRDDPDDEQRALEDESEPRTPAEGKAEANADGAPDQKPTEQRDRA